MWPLALAMKVVTIQEYEGRWLLPLLSQAQRNLGEQAHIGTIVIDRGYLDGADLWQVHHRGILFVIVGKANMSVVQDAQGLAKGERAMVRERVVGPGEPTLFNRPGLGSQHHLSDEADCSQRPDEQAAEVVAAFGVGVRVPQSVFTVRIIGLASMTCCTSAAIWRSLSWSGPVIR